MTHESNGFRPKLRAAELLRALRHACWSPANRPYFLWGAAALLLPAIFFAASVHFRHRGDITHAIRVGRTYYAKYGVAELTRKARPLVGRAQDGFDGQFFYFMAFDPLFLNEATPRSLDIPPKRARRIAFAWAGRLLAFGRHRIPEGLVAAQLVCLLAFIAAVQMRGRAAARHPALALLLAVNLGVFVPLEYMTCEMMGGALLVLALALDDRNKLRGAWCCLALACLTKEVFVLAAAGMFIDALLRRKIGRAALYATSLLPLAAWIVYLRFRLPPQPFAGETIKDLGIPFLGAATSLISNAQSVPGTARPMNEVVQTLGVLWFLSGALVGIARLALRRSASRWTAALAGVLAACLAGGHAAPDYAYVFNYARQLALLPFALAADHMIGAENEGRREKLALRIWFGAGAAIAVLWCVLRLMGREP